MGASLSNPHFLAFADHYNDAQGAGRAPLTWREFLDTRRLGPGARGVVGNFEWEGVVDEPVA